ncbi:MAG TPA: non-homologous end-joining DNA ligase [Rudaea sp.]|nr:non-homologous end-joining DNA ligase [Rudaea sp.]
MTERYRTQAFAPELCRLENMPPAGPEWVHETKWDGYRIVATVAYGTVRLWSRNGIEWTHKVPELAAAVASLGTRSAKFDGEMIVLHGKRDDFGALQRRLSAENAQPATYMLFDMPYLDGKSLTELPLVDRKQALEDLLARHPHPLLRYSVHEIGNGARALARATRAGFEGIVSKRAQSPYRYGARNGDWVKVKDRPSDEFVVIGYTPPKGSRAGFGALLLAKPQDGRLVYIGRVGTGFTNAQLVALRKRLGAAKVSDPPADIHLVGAKDRAVSTWTKPEFVVEVYHQGIGTLGLLRQPAFKAMRLDKKPRDLGK